METPVAEIIAVGDGLLLGYLADVSTPRLSRLLDEEGFRVRYRTTVGSNAADLAAVLQLASRRAAVTVVAGGPDATTDDLIRTTLVAYFGGEWQPHSDARADDGRQQAPPVAVGTHLPNRLGSAPGLWFAAGGQVVVALPAAASQAETMTREEVLPRLHDHFLPPARWHRTCVTVGADQTTLAEVLRPWQAALPPHVKLTFLPTPGGVTLRLSAEGQDGRAPDDLPDRLAAEMADRLAPYALDAPTLEETVGRRLRARGWTIATAESCTGGYLAYRTMREAGSSAFFKGGVVAYDNQIKQAQLGVPAAVLSAHGAVSEPTVRAMAEGVRARLGTHVGVATSGVAGPGGGTPGKPVGTVWLAVATPDRTTCRQLHLTTDRALNIRLTAVHALNLVRQMLG